jgi:hypothetical protein
VACTDDPGRLTVDSPPAVWLLTAQVVRVLATAIERALARDKVQHPVDLVVADQHGMALRKDDARLVLAAVILAASPLGRVLPRAPVTASCRQIGAMKRLFPRRLTERP